MKFRKFSSTEPLKTAAMVLYATKKTGMFADLPQLERFAHINLDWFNQIYPPGFELIPERYRNGIRQRLLKILSEMVLPHPLNSLDLENAPYNCHSTIQNNIDNKEISKQNFNSIDRVTTANNLRSENYILMISNSFMLAYRKLQLDRFSVLRKNRYSAIEFKEPILTHLENNPHHRDYFIFSFVRNPWSRIYSTWKNKIANPNMPEEKRTILKRFDELYYNMPFEEFVSFVCESKYGNDIFGDRH